MKEFWKEEGWHVSSDLEEPYTSHATTFVDADGNATLIEFLPGTLWLQLEGMRVKDQAHAKRIIDAVLDQPNPDPWKGWEKDDVLQCWKRYVCNEDGLIPYGVIHVLFSGELVVFGQMLPIGDPDEARAAAEGLVRGPVRWADEVDR